MFQVHLAFVLFLENIVILLRHFLWLSSRFLSGLILVSMVEWIRRWFGNYCRKVFWRIVFCEILHCRGWERISFSCSIFWTILRWSAWRLDCFGRRKSHNRIFLLRITLRMLWVFLNSRKMRFSVFLLEETKFFYKTLLIEILLHLLL